MVIRVRDLAENWLKDCGDRQAVIDTVVKEQFMEVLHDDVRIWVKERKPQSSQEAGKLTEDTDKPEKQSCGPQHPLKVDENLATCVDKLVTLPRTVL